MQIFVSNNIPRYLIFNYLFTRYKYQYFTYQYFYPNFTRFLE